MAWKKFIPGGNGGTGGGIPNPDSGVLADNEMLKSNVGGTAIVGTGDTNTDTEVNFGTKTLRAATGAFDSGSIDMVGYTLNERGGYLQTVSKTTGRTFISLDYQVDNNGTQKPLYDSRSALTARQIKQADDTQTITGLTSYAVTPDISQDISQIYFKFVNPVDNFRARIISDVTGEVVSYIPSRSAFDKDEGVSLVAGEQTFSPETVLPELIGFPLTVEVFADQSIDVLGDAGGNPWRAVDVQDIISLQILDETDVALESTSTSLIDGGLISEASPTTIDVAAGNGRIVSIDGNGVSTVTQVSWAAQTGITITNIATQIATRIGVDENGIVTQLPIDLTPEAARDYVNLGGVYHATGTIGSVLNDSLKSQEIYSQMVDSIEVLGITRKKGLSVSGNADLSFNKTAGELQSSGGGNDSGTRGQNIVRISGESPANFTRFLGVTDDPTASGQTLIDPLNYDNGSGSPVAIGTPIQQATIQYVYQSIVDPAGVLVMYGQTVYPTVSDALLNADLDVVDRPSTIEQETNLIARIVVSTDAVNLQDDTKAVILSGVKFGSGTDGTLSGSISGGGDYLGAASSSADEIHTFADASGKVGKAASDVTAVNGVLKRSSASSGIELQSSNGISKVNVTPTNVNIVAKNASDSSTTTMTLLDSNGAQFGGASTNVDSTSGSIGYKSSQNGSFKNQIYWNAAEDLTHISHKGTNSNPNTDIILSDTDLSMEFAGTQELNLDNTGRMEFGANTFPAGDTFVYPGTDGVAGDYIITDAAGNLTFDASRYITPLTGATLNYEDRYVKLDSSAGDLLLFLAANPRDGERKTFWMRNNDNLVTLESADPNNSPLRPNKEVAEDALECAYTLDANFNDRYLNQHNLTVVGTQGSFVSDTVNGRTVQVYDFAGTGALVASGTSYKGVTGGQARTVCFWAGANNGEVLTGQQILTGWGSNAARARYDMRLDANGLTLGITTVNKVWDNAALTAAGLFDGNMHHMALVQTSNTTQSVELYIDLVLVPHTAQIAGTLSTGSTRDLRVGDGVSDTGVGGKYFDGRMYDYRLFDRALSIEELTNVFNSEVTGSIDLTPMQVDTVIDVAWDGSFWQLSVGYITELIGHTARLENLELNSNKIYEGNTELAIDGAAGKAVLDSELAATLDLKSATGENSTVNFIEDTTTKAFATYDATAESLTVGSSVNDVSVILSTALNSIELNDVTGNVNISDGGNGNANFFFGGLRLSNPSDSPHFEFADSTEAVLAGMQWETADGGYNQFYHGNGFSVFNNELRMYSNRTTSSRGIDITSNTEAFFPPRVTTAQMNAITPAAGATAFNTELGLPVFGDGVAWNTVSTTTSVSCRTNVQNNIAMAGLFQTIQSGTFNYYEVDGTAATPNFTNGAWVIDVGGTYIFNIRGWAFNNTGTENQARFYVGVNGNDYVSQPNVGIDVVTKDGSGLTLSGTVRLNAGDVVRIGYSVLSGTGWEVDGFAWDANRVGS